MAEKKTDHQKLVEEIKEIVKAELKGGQSKNLPVPITAGALQLPTTQQLKDHLCPGISDSDAFIFLEKAKLFALNPFKGEIYAMPFKDRTGEKRYSPVIDYHVFLARAKQYPTYLYFEAGLRYDENKKADGAWCKIYDEKFGKGENGQPRFFYHEIDADEYDKKQSTWLTKRNTMLKKTAIRQAHNLCYPELAGLPPVKDMLIVDASGEIIDANGRLSPTPKREKPKVDEGFFTGEAETPGAEKNEAKFITGNEYGDMVALANEAGVNPRCLFTHCKELHRISSLQKIPKKILPKVLDWIKEQGEKKEAKNEPSNP